MTNIRIDHNLKFKTATLGCFLRLPLDKKTLALANILACMQSNASKAFPGINVQARTFSNLYNASLQVFPEVFGNQIVVFYTINFVEPREILDPDYNYQVVMDAFFKVVKEPLFDGQLLELAKRQLEQERKQYYELPANFALSGFFNNWYRSTPNYQDSVFGDEETLKNASLEEVKSFFDTLRNAPAFCLGQAQDPDSLTDLVQQQIDWAGYFDDFVVPTLSIPTKEDPIEKEIQFKSEQAQLLIGYGYDQSLPVHIKQFGGLFLGEYLAGDESSKLFTEVRKKLGAAYAIDATNYVNNSLFLISTGISKDKITAATKAIKSSVKAVQEGKVDEDTFVKAKAALKRNYQISTDRQDLILIQMLANALRGRDYTFTQRISDVDRFKIEKLVEFSQKLYFNESYCLK
ncbi:MAG: insulinase family protein [Lactobacillus sp.]|uniref:M16 family metallopeptidase n=1 Tax=Lactobacillus sp. TaxID=1591 RepID=UPI0023CCD996|nr:insulinase family protein [Lactobacillus sp.]MDE7050965.1 insulinase family protein [Lactobacillus sp.]